MSGMSQAVSALALRSAVVDGVNATTQTVTGIATTDTLVFVGHFTPGATATFADVTSDTTISAADTITVGSDYSSDRLVILWHDGSQAAAVNQAQETPCLRFDLIDGVNATTQTLTGITTSDTILSALLWSTKAAVAAVDDITSTMTITDADEVTVSADYSSDLMMVIWHDADGVGYSSTALRIDLVDGHATEKALTGMVASDVILFAGHFTLKADITTLVDGTTNCTAAAGKVEYGATTADDQMWIFWLDSSA